jgi:5'-deoxynucleotidase YfbR-like HD superfamily hydrolase
VIEPRAVGRRGDWFLTFSGVQFWPLDPRPEEVFLADVAHALSRVCRYGGHCLDFYSVAQHSVMVSEIVPPELALHGLFHDAEEAYTGDLIRPLKVGLREVTTAWDEMADRVTAAVAARFGLRELSDAEWAEIKSADNTALSTERRDLVRDVGREWRVSKSHPPLARRIVPVERDEAKSLFLARFAELWPAGPSK